MDYTKDYTEACEMLHDDFTDLMRKIKSEGLKPTYLDMLDKLTHSIASIKKTIMMEQDDGYSGMYPYMGGYGRYSRDGSSYARGRNARRDSMGRYSGERGYSRTDFADKMRDLMEDAPDDRTRQEIQRMVEKLENA